MSKKNLDEDGGDEELSLIEQFIKEGKFDEALRLMKEYEEKEGRTPQEIVTIHLCKSNVFDQQGLLEKAVEFAEETYKESLGLGKNILTVDTLLSMANILIRLGRLDQAYDKIIKGEELLNSLTHVLSKDIMVREAYIAFNKGLFYYFKEDTDQALKHTEYSLVLREKLGLKYGIMRSLLLLPWIVGHLKGDLNRAIEYAEQGIVVAKEINIKDGIAFGLRTLATFLSFKGEIKRSISYYKQNLSIQKELNNKEEIATTLNSLGIVYKMKGDFDQALTYIERSLAISNESGNLGKKAKILDSLIGVLIEKGEIERVHHCVNDLEQIYKQLKDKPTTLLYLYNKAILLKTSSRASNRAKAEELLKQLLEEEDLPFEHNTRVLLNLCELLLIELRITNDSEVLEEIESLITQLLKVAEESHSFWILGEIYLLQSKLALVSFDLKKARRKMIKGQELAENYGLNRLAIKISNEHDELLKQLSIWESFESSKTPLADRIELARLNEQIGNMTRRRVIENPKILDEDPIVVLIISKGGKPIFTQSFAEDWVFPDHVIGGFITAISSFSDEMFSEGLNRAIFGQHTILMRSVPPFLVCYLFKGQSYIAQQKLVYFVQNIQKDKSLWQTFIKFYQTKQEIQSKDIPSLEPLIFDIFINRNIPLNV
ncbi:MAG: tetratricopeptide repeat protein [Candidatus Hodarchaeota archaeon]